MKIFPAALVAVSLVAAAPAAAQPCPADCSGDLHVTVDELVKCVEIGLGRRDLATCPGCDADSDGAAEIEELVSAVHVALEDLIVNAGGTCLQPGSGPGGLTPCDAGTEVALSRCRDRGECLANPGSRMPLDAATVAADGSFSLTTCNATGATLLFEASVAAGEQPGYRVLSFGPLASGGGSGGPAAVTLDDVSISPRSEAAVRVLEANGLESFDAAGVEEILAAVERATQAIDFSNLGVEDAADVATSTASESQAVQQAVEENRLTPTSTPTATPSATATFTPTPVRVEVDVTAEGSVSASSVFGGDDFPASLAVDGSRLTSWFSDGAAGGPTETFEWVGARDDLLTSISVLSNAQHPRSPGFGFGSVRIEVRNAAGQLVSGGTFALPGATDPDVTVMPNVSGRSVRLTFTDHDDPSCGGFSELVIRALR
jgi:hypothetical protein